MTAHEAKIAKEIREDKSNGKNTWKYIKMLKGEKEKERENLLDNIYGEDGEKIRDVQGEFNQAWGAIYRKHTNDIKEVWQGEEKQEYERKRERLKGNVENRITYKVVRAREREELII